MKWCLPLAACIFLFSLVVANPELRSQPVWETGDFAANALEVHEAKHFRALLGNYSRWRFHHPGPAFFYAYAAGEALFRDVLGLAPAPFNAHLAAVLILNTLFVFAAFSLVRAHHPGPWVVPFMIASILILAWTINRTIPGSALVSIWPPYVLLFPFVLFSVAAASVTAGRIEHLPIAAGVGMLLVHGHVAQPLFVVPMLTLAVVRGVRATGGWPRFRAHTRSFVLCVALVAVFSAPIVIDIVAHEPDNLDALWQAARAQPRFANTLWMSLRYFVSLLAFCPHPEQGWLISGSVTDNAVVLCYWALFVVLGILAWRLVVRRAVPCSQLVLGLLAQAFLASILFLVWGMKITGGLYLFNGFFGFGLQWLAWLVIAIILAERLGARAAPLATAVSLVLPLVILASPGRFTNIERGDPDIPAIVAAAQPRPTDGWVLRFQDEAWPPAIGTARGLQREGVAFCVDSQWGFMFGTRHVCSQRTPGNRNFLVFRKNLTHASQGARQVFARDGLGVFAIREQPLTWPVEIGPDDGFDIKDGFHVSERRHRWSGAVGAIRFRLAETAPPMAKVLVEVTGFGVPGRPAALLINGRSVGTVDHPREATTRLEVSSDVFRDKAENEVVLQVPNAGPVGRDTRDLGFALMRIRLSPIAEW